MMRLKIESLTNNINDIEKNIGKYILQKRQKMWKNSKSEGFSSLQMVFKSLRQKVPKLPEEIFRVLFSTHSGRLISAACTWRESVVA